MADEDDSQTQQKKAKYPCIRCKKNVTKNSKSVRCGTCQLWVHVDCENISTELFNILSHPEKFGGMVTWTCDSCVASSAKIEQYVKAYTERISAVENRLSANEGVVKDLDRKVEKIEDKLREKDDKVEKCVKQSQIDMYEELNEREVRRMNVIMYKVREVEDERATGRDRQEWDRKNVIEIMNSIGMKAVDSDIKFTRRLGEAGRDPRPICIGFHNESDKNWLLRKGRELERTRFKEVNVCPDLTRNQRQTEQNMRREAERRNEQDLTEDDRQKNLRWAVVGAKGLKRLVKTTAREMGTWSTQERHTAPSQQSRPSMGRAVDQRRGQRRPRSSSDEDGARNAPPGKR